MYEILTDKNEVLGYNAIKNKPGAVMAPNLFFVSTMIVVNTQSSMMTVIL